MTFNAYSTLSQSRNYSRKSEAVQQIVAEALDLLHQLGLPMHNTARRLERMSIAFLAVANIKSMDDWANIVSKIQNHHLKTRDIIEFMNTHFEEDISRGSYDDIRRKDLKLLLEADVIVHTEPATARNNPNRAYMLSPVFVELIQHYKTTKWSKLLSKFMSTRTKLVDELSTSRDIPLIPVNISADIEILFSPGEHNQLQKAIIEQFLPRYGYGAEVLYVGDTTNKYLFLEEERLRKLQFFEIGHGELPDIVAYSSTRNWLYLIEAVHTSGPITQLRLRNLKRLAKNCTAELIFITAFLNRTTFRKFVADIAWETEVWIAEDPDHLIHFDGEKFLGPYQNQ